MMPDFPRLTLFDRIMIGAGLMSLIVTLVSPVPAQGNQPFWYWLLVGVASAGLWRIMVLGTRGGAPRTAQGAVPVLFGLWLLYLWQVITAGFHVPSILLPTPLQILDAFVRQAPVLWQDFQQTFLKAVIAGFLMGSGAGIAVAILVDRVPFLQRGLLPMGNLVSAMPIVGIAPIMVMWFGFDWQSKAAVAVIVTFFPMLINMLAGLGQTDPLHRDLMRSYGAGYWQDFFKLRLPASLPFIFNALKINATLALIAAIVAEFFGSPIQGLGFRISVEVARLNVDVVWATIAVAAMAGSASYGLLAIMERSLTFWHPSYRK